MANRDTPATYVQTMNFSGGGRTVGDLEEGCPAPSNDSETSTLGDADGLDWKEHVDERPGIVDRMLAALTRVFCL